MSAGYRRIREELLRQAREGTLFHALLLEGEESLRAKELALELSRLLLERENLEACSDFTVLEKNEMSMENLRRRIADSFVEPLSKKKIFLIEQADRMSVQMQNALLKTLEEPPEYLVFFLLCRNQELLLPTLRSRCLHCYLPSETGIAEKEEEILREDRERISAFFEALGGKDALRIMRAVDGLKFAKERSEELLQGLLIRTAALLRAKESGGAEDFSEGSLSQAVQNCKDRLTGFELLQIIDIMEEARRKILSRCAPGAVFEVLLFDILEVLGCRK